MAGKMMASELACHLAPPVCQSIKRIFSIGSFPIDLRRNVVDGALLYPFYRVGIDAVILPVATIGATFHTVACRHTAAGASDAGGRDAEAHPRLRRSGDTIIDSLYHTVDVITSPIAEIQRSAGVLPITVIAGTICFGDAVGIEVVVKDYTVDVVVVYDFKTHVANAVD